eukprot:4028610-Pyramimonas_sp.AAC.1
MAPLSDDEVHKRQEQDRATIAALKQQGYGASKAIQPVRRDAPQRRKTHRLQQAEGYSQQAPDDEVPPPPQPPQHAPVHPQVRRGYDHPDAADVDEFEAEEASSRVAPTHLPTCKY